MSRAVDRRSIFFLLAAVVSLATLVITPSEYYWVGYCLAALYVVLAAASFLDHWSRTRPGPPR